MTDARLIVIDPMADQRWGDYVRSRPDATPYHLAAYVGVLRDAYRFRPCCLALEADGALCGVLPLARGGGAVSRRRLRSLPVVPVGGPLADDDAAAAALVAEALRVGAQRGLQVTVDSPTLGLERLDHTIAVVERPPTWVADLPERSGVDGWLQERSKNLVRGIRRAERAGVTARLATGAADLRRFHRMYLATMRKHRSLPRTLRQLELTRRMLETEGVFRLFLAEHDGRAAGGGVFHAFNGTLELLYAASDDALLDHRPNHALYRHVVAWSADAGYARLDWGFAWPDSSLASFKAQWGGRPVPRVRYVNAGPAAPATDTGTAMLARLERGPARLALDAWGHAPLTLTDLAGRFVYRWL